MSQVKNNDTGSAAGVGGLVIPGFEKKIKEAKGIVKKPKGKLARASKVRPFFVPPLNTNIVLSKLKKEKVSKKKLARALVLPENFNLRDAYPIIICGDRNDPSTSQFQQYACGCCWAYAIATSISDVFVVQNKYLTNPNLSWTYILSCFPNINNPGDGSFPVSSLCGGGDVPTTLLWLQQNGIPSSTCVDYAWCLNDPNCTGSGTDTKEMDKAIPSCGCYRGGNFFKYKIKDVRRIALDQSNDQNPEQIALLHSQMKQHLFVTGTMVGCFIVLENIVGVNPNSLKTGDFKSAKNPEGVYLECVGVEEELKSETPSSGNDLDGCIYRYENNAAVAPETKAETLGILGAHAVSVVGWGLAPVHRSLVRPDIERLYPSLKTYDKDAAMVMVPYWWIRNSWGTGFAENGFFKMAAYPFNRITCVDRSINIKTDGRNISAGGSVLFFADQVVRDSFPENDQKGRTPVAVANADKEQGGGSAVETGHFEGANKSSSVGKAIPYTPLSYLPESDVLPQTGVYQPPNAQQSSAAPSSMEKGAPQVVGFGEEEAVSAVPEPKSKVPFYIIIGLLVVVNLAALVAVICPNKPDMCPSFLQRFVIRPEPLTPTKEGMIMPSRSIGS